MPGRNGWCWIKKKYIEYECLGEKCFWTSRGNVDFQVRGGRRVQTKWMLLIQASLP